VTPTGSRRRVHRRRHALSAPGQFALTNIAALAVLVAALVAATMTGPAAARESAARPVCTNAAVHHAIKTQTHPQYRWSLVGLQCAGRYAVVAVEDLTDGAEFTVLLHWTAAHRWRVIDRERACNRGRVPAKIRMLTCQSN
jgi:hypothetical protein